MLPKDFLDRMKILLKDDYQAFLDSYNSKPVRAFFINTNKIEEQKFLSICDWNIEKCEQGYILKNDIKVGKSVEHHSGMIYMQELSAMMPTSFLPLKDTDLVLDLCAAPGGKSIQVANRLTNGCLVSNEIVKNRANVLAENVERMGLSNICVINNDPKELENYFQGIFDAVIVDAPCSGEGMFRKDEGAVQDWSKEHVLSCQNRQLAILSSANKFLKQNGYLLYSTCTFSLEENEGVVAQFCKMYDYSIIRLNYDGAVDGEKIDGLNTNFALRFYPHKFKGEGQFVALLRKNQEENERIAYKNNLKLLVDMKKENEVFKDFAKNSLSEYERLLKNLIINNNIIYYAKNLAITRSGVRLVNCGVKIGEIMKGRFEPNHNFASSFGDLFKNKVDLSKDQAEKYLKGETVEVGELSGYAVVRFQGVNIGLGKVNTGVMKNHYPKSLRNIN